MPKKPAPPKPKISKVKLTSRGGHTTGFSEVQKHLVHFGYLPEKHRKGYLDEPTSKALAKYQAFHRLPVTGKFDKPTKESMRIARCGHPDIVEDSDQRCKWNKRDFTYAIEDDFDKNPNYGLLPGVASQLVRDACICWEQRTIISGSKQAYITFTEVGLDENPDILIGYRQMTTDPDDPKATDNTLAHSSFPPPCNNSPTPRPLHFDTTHTWANGEGSPWENSWDIGTVAIHEIGHFLGLFHRTDDPNSVMVPKRRMHTVNRMPDGTDTTLLLQLYD